VPKHLRNLSDVTNGNFKQHHKWRHAQVIIRVKSEPMISILLEMYNNISNSEKSHDKELHHSTRQQLPDYANSARVVRVQ